MTSLVTRVGMALMGQERLVEAQATLDAAKDIHDLRQLIDGWRDIKSTAVKTMVRWVVLCLLGCISIGVYMSLNK